MLGALLPILPLKAAGVLIALVFVGMGVVIAIKMPDKKRVPYALIYTIFLVAIASKFLWPNFAYLPIPGLPSKNPQRWIWALCVCYWAYSILVNEELRDRLAYRFRASGLAKLLGVLLVWRFASIFVSEEPVASAYAMIIDAFEYFMAFVFCLTWIRGADDVKRVGVALVTATAIISLYAIAEVALKQNVFVKFVPYDPTNDMFLTMAVESKLREGGYRAQASFNHPLLMAQFVVTMMPVIFYTLFRQHGMAKRSLAFFAMCSVPFLLWASRTRTAVLVAGVVLAVGFVVVSLNAARRTRRSNSGSILGGIGLLFAAGLLSAVSVAAVYLTMGRTAEESMSSLARVQMIEKAFGSSLREPLLGYGPALGNLQAAIYSSRGSASLDNYWLTLLLESGYPAMVMFLLALVLALRGIALQVFKGHLTSEYLLLAAWSLATLAFGVTTSILSTTHNLTLLNICFGVLVALTFPLTTANSQVHATDFLRRESTGRSGALSA